MLFRSALRHGPSGAGSCLYSGVRVSGLPGVNLAHRFLPQQLLSVSKKAISIAAPFQADNLRQRRKDIVPTADTIYALSTAAGRSAIAVIRVSGPACLDVYGAICPDRPFPHPRVATVRRLRDPHNRTRILDHEALVFYFPAPKTVTGDDVLEFHVHGGPAIIRSVLEAIPHCMDSRPRRRTADYSVIRAAEPGEFTKRAFYNGRLDLTQAEALGETLAAETEQQRRLAVAGVESGLAVRYDKWRNILLYARGELEALIDFSEDQHFDESPAELLASVSAQVNILNEQIKVHINNASRGELLRNGISVALLGAPNAGKSSLLNLIVGREAAIVSPEAGTTRDIVDVQVDVAGWLVRLGDMAGLRGDGTKSRNLDLNNSSTNSQPIGEVEREGIRRARERALQADLVIIVICLVKDDNGAISLSINPELVNATEQCRNAGKTLVFVVNKIDLIVNEARDDAICGLRRSISETFYDAHEGNVFFVSCKDASSSSSHNLEFPLRTLSDPGGVQTFLSGLSQTFTNMTSAATESDPSQLSATQTLTPAESQSYWTASLSITHRQVMYLLRCRTHLEDFLAQCTTRAGASTLSSHHVDAHDDLVGERISAPTGLRDDLEDHLDIVTAAEHLRYAAECLSKITGRGEGGDVEDVLGVVFEK